MSPLDEPLWNGSVPFFDETTLEHLLRLETLMLQVHQFRLFKEYMSAIGSIWFQLRDMESGMYLSTVW